MKKNKMILLTVFSILLLALIIILSILIFSKKSTIDSLAENVNTNIESNTTSNIIENEQNVTNEIANDIINDISNNVIPTDLTISKVDTSIKEDTTPKQTNTTIPSTASSNTSVSSKLSNNTSLQERPKSETNNVTEKNEDSSKQNNVTESKKEDTPTNTETDNTRPELAYSTYRVTNTAIVPEIIKILNDEISKADDLVAYGCKAVAGNKTDAYAKTTGFTYLFVNDIHKGKVAGNYTTFEQRVRNNVGAFANYNVYAEDEYTYDGRGLNPQWCQTLVWIYLTF